MSDDSKSDSQVRSWIQRWEGAGAAQTGVWAERRRLAEAMRVLIERLTTTDAPEAELRVAAERLEQYAEHLGSQPRHRRYEGYAESATADSGSPEGGGHFDWSPLIGRANPLAPPIEMRSEAGRVKGRVVFGTAYEGPPGCVHGGFVAAAFDEVLGYVQALTGNPGFTGTLTVRYRSPTPLHTELLFDVVVDRVEGRKIFTRGTVHAGDRLCAEGEAVFISVDRTRYKDLIAKRR